MSQANINISKMNISVVVITYNEESNISECIESLMAQDYKNQYEVIISDGKSKDNTIKIVEKYIKKYGNRLRLIVKEGYSQNQSRNIGIKSAKYDFVAFTDADCIVPKNWLSILAKKYIEHKKNDPSLAGVGGANIPPINTENNFLKAIGIAFDSWIGSLGSIQAKPLDRDKKVFSISCTNSVYNKKKLVDCGMFPNYKQQLSDDWILGLRMKNKNYTLIGLKDSFVWHKMRASPKKFWKNMILYGSVRMHAIKTHFKENSTIYFLPLIFILAMISSLVLFIILKYSIFLLVLAYFPIMFLYSTLLCLKKKKLNLTLSVFLVFLILHFGYSLGELYGLKWFFIKDQ